MKCPKCNSSKRVKNGFVKERQRYKCSNCSYNYSVNQKSGASSIDVRKFGLMMYLEGLGFQSIGRLLGVSHVAVMKWIKKYGEQIRDIKTDKPVQIIEMDEMHTYIGSKKTIDGFGLLLIETENASLISLLGTGVQKPVKKYGKKSKNINPSL